MKLLLTEFEHQIDEVILKRGFDYFRKGSVTDVDELGGGEYEITVEGSDTYTVCLSIKGDAVTEFECDCPYDMGPVCKHVVAALFYLQKDILGMMEIPAKNAKNTKKEQKGKSVAEQVEEILGVLSHDALKTFIHDNCAKDSKFRQLFLAKHIQLLYPVSKELYIKQLRALIKTHSDKHGYIDYQAARRFGDAVCEIAGEGMVDLREGRIQKSMFIAFAIIEEISELVSHNVDDSDGHIGGSVEEAFTILDTLAGMDLDKPLHDDLFNLLLTLFEGESLKGWDWHFEVISLGIKVLKTDREKERVKSALDKIKSKGRNRDWDYEKAQELMLEFIKKTESGEAAARFVENNLSNSGFRVELIEKSLEAKDYARVESLAHEGIAKDEKEAPGLANNWRSYLLICYQQTGEIQKTIQLARYFFIHSNGHRHPLAYYYNLLKSLIPVERWPDYRRELVAGIKAGSRWVDYDRISWVSIWESDWAELFALLKQNASLDRIAGAEQYLAGSYANELAALYKALIPTYLEQHVGREHYQAVCRYIRRMIKLGAGPMATDLVRELRALYPRRKALLEELGKV